MTLHGENFDGVPSYTGSRRPRTIPVGPERRSDIADSPI
jgi:hypothetical protein